MIMWSWKKIVLVNKVYITSLISYHLNLYIEMIYQPKTLENRGSVKVHYFKTRICEIGKKIRKGQPVVRYGRLTVSTCGTLPIM